VPRILYERCPLCGDESKPQHVREADCSQHPLSCAAIEPIMRWLRCSGCEHVYTDGYFDKQQFEALKELTLQHQLPGEDFERQRVVSARIVERVAEHIDHGAWLDVGFGNGSLLFTAEEFGFEVTGLEMRYENWDLMRELEIETLYRDITTLAEFDYNFAVISMCDVLEHMPYPKQALEAAYRLLQPDGVLLLSMPHYNCTAWRLLDKFECNPYWAELEHFHNFSRERLYELLRECEFTPHSYHVSQRYRVCMEIIAVK